MLQESHIVLKQQSDIVDTVLQHRDPLNTDTECDAGVDVRVNSAVLQNLGMDHAAAEHFNPAGMLAQAAALSAAFKAADVHFNARFREGEIAGTEPCTHVRVKDLLHKLIQHALQVTQGNALVHHKAFHLVEHGRMGRVAVGAENPSGNQHLDRRLLHIHYPDLASAGLYN